MSEAVLDEWQITLQQKKKQTRSMSEREASSKLSKV
jgi:hypothetical protein